MKNQTLSIEQMKHLKDLGVDTSKASIVCLFIDENCNEIDWGTVENHGKDKHLYEWYDDEYGHWVEANPEYFAAESGTYDHSNRESCGVFTLQDMLEMIPVYVLVDNVEYWMELYLDTNCITETERNYHMRYKDINSKSVAKVVGATSVLESAYLMLCWLAENNYLNKEEQ